MATSRLPSIDALPSLSALERADVLDQLFEPCLQLHTLSVELLGSERFPSYDDMIASIGVQLTDLAESGLDSDLAWLAKILGAHPRLGEKKVDSAQSRAEQAQLNTGRANQEAELTDLNDQYERTFPGLRYVVFVNGRGRSIIMDDMRSRIARGDIQLERAEAIKAMCDIAADRARKLEIVSR